MVKKRFVYVNASKQTNEADNGLNRIVRVDVEDCEVKKLSSKNVNEKNLPYCANASYNG
jgi:hypothetical protein